MDNVKEDIKRIRKLIKAWKRSVSSYEKEGKLALTCGEEHEFNYSFNGKDYPFIDTDLMEKGSLFQKASNYKDLWQVQRRYKKKEARNCLNSLLAGLFEPNLSNKEMNCENECKACRLSDLSEPVAKFLTSGSPLLDCLEEADIDILIRLDALHKACPELLDPRRLACHKANVDRTLSACESISEESVHKVVLVLQVPLDLSYTFDDSVTNNKTADFGKKAETRQ
ncbi:hypothetical protein II898_04225 [bacterium]|nr:hypothetical protein [bacterium]